MKKVLVLLFISLYTNGLLSRYEIVDSAVEFRQLLDEHDYTLACFVDMQSEKGRFLAETMEFLALSDNFGKALHDRFAFVVIPAQRVRLAKLAEKYDYQGDPLFALFEFDRLIEQNNLQGDYRPENIEQFIFDLIEDSLEELLFDIEQIKEADRNLEEYVPSCRVTFGQESGLYPRRGFLFQGKPYWWYRRYHKAPYKYGPKPRVKSRFNR